MCEIDRRQVSRKMFSRLMPISTFLALIASAPLAAEVTGTFTGIVVSATDLNNASFGRDPSEWIGKSVTGTFSFDPNVPGISDTNPDPDEWVLQPSPGPGPFIEFVKVTALIDGRLFETSRADFDFIFFGDVVGMQDAGAYRWFGPQDSYVGTGSSGTGRSVVGFDAYFLPGGDSFDGTSLTIDPQRFQFGSGVVNDLLENSGGQVRSGTIAFNVTSVSVTSTPKTPEELLTDLVTAVLQLNVNAGIGNALDSKLQNALQALESAQSDDVASAVGMLSAFIHSVEAQRGKALTGAQADALVTAAQTIISALEQT